MFVSVNPRPVSRPRSFALVKYSRYQGVDDSSDDQYFALMSTAIDCALVKLLKGKNSPSDHLNNPI